MKSLEKPHYNTLKYKVLEAERHHKNEITFDNSVITLAYAKQLVEYNKNINRYD
jgi:hypothetical protein